MKMERTIDIIKADSEKCKVKKMRNDLFLPHVCELVAQGHKVSIRPKGVSMRPFLESDRDVAFLAKPYGVKVGDVVLAELSSGTYVLHRIVKIEGEKVVMRGDGNIRGSEACLLNDVRAVAVGFERKGRYWSVDTSFWKIYSYVWPRLFPIRRLLLALYRIFFLGEWSLVWKKISGK